MKQGLQQIKRKQLTAVNKKRNNVTYLRPRVASRSNHTRLVNDKWERQADSASARILRGEEGVARTLTPAPAASFQSRTSTGHPLSHDVRQDMENRFGADLSVVRIHRDTNADSVARSEGAKAFTAGSHIYFSEGLYCSDTLAGQELIAHELTHVLQQTGRVASNGTIRATDIHGSGDIQRDALFDNMVQAYRSEAALEVPTPLEPTTQTQRQRAIETAIQVVIEITGSAQTLNHTVGESTAALLLEQTILDAETTEAQALRSRLDLEPMVARSFIYDALKLLGRHEGAAEMVDNEPALRSYVREGESAATQLGEYFEFLRSDDDYGLSWFYELIDDLPNVNWPYSLLQNLWTYLTRPERGAYTTSEYDNAFAAMERANSRVLGFGINERQHGAYLLLRGLDQQVTGYVETIESSMDQNSDLTYRKQEASRRLIEAGRLLEGESSAHQRRLGRNIRTTAEAALGYWDQAEEMFRLMMQGGGEQLSEPPDIPILQLFIDDVATHSRQLLYSAEPDVIVPTQTEYQANIQAFVEMLQGYQATDTNVPQPDTLAHFMEWNLFRFEHRSNEEAIARASWLGWAMRWSEGAIGRLSIYSAERDIAFSQTHHRDDIRWQHRLEMSRIIWGFALLTRNANLREAAALIQSGEDVNTSYIMLTGTWNQDESADIDQMNEDFANVTVRQFGVSTQQLVSIFRLLHLRAFNTALQQGLMVHEGDLSGGQRTLVNEAVAAADAAVPMPTRWTHSDYEIVWHTREGEERPDTLLEDLLRNHPVFTNFRDAHSTATGGRMIIPYGYSNRVIAWKLPPLTQVITYLRSIDTLNNLVIRLAELPTEVADQTWYDALINLAEEGLDTEEGQNAAQRRRRRRLLGLIHGGLNQDIESENVRRSRLLTRSTIRRRRVLVDQLNPAIQAYIDGDIRDYVVPNRALDAIEQFIFYVQPRDTDAGPQEAALTLGIAEKLEAMFIRDWWFVTIREQRYDLVTGFYGAVQRAINMARNNPVDIRRVLFIPENLTAQERQEHGQQGSVYEQADDLLDNVTSLDRVMESLNQVISDVQQRFGFESVSGNSVKSLEFAHEFPISEVIDIQGHTYMISAIGRPFRFHPPYGERTDARSDALVNNLDGTPIAENAHILTFTIDTGEPVRVLNNPEGQEQLELLSDVLGVAGFVASLDALEQAILDAGELGLDILELVPGIGQGVMAARALYAVTLFIAQDLPAIKEQLVEDPQIILREIMGFISAELPQFIEVMLFGEIPFESRLLAEEEEEEPRRRGRRGAARRLRQLFDFVKEMIEDAMRGFVRLRGRLRAAFVGAQGRIAANRILLQVVDALPTLLVLGSEAIEIAEALQVPSFSDLETRLQEEIQNILNGFAEIELPEDIIPLDVAVEVLLSFGLSRLPGRKGRVIAHILELTGAVNQASQLIAGALDAGGANPNILWQREIRSHVQPLLANAQIQLFKAVADLIREATNGRINLSNPTVQTPQITTDESVPEIPETEGMLQNNAQQDDEDELTLPDTRGGMALNTNLRKQYRHEFGHNFDHVRIHRNPSARQFTRSAQARALTSGSHIFLNDSVNPDSAQSQFILRHELSHVLQQTGPRPANKHHSGEPILGRSGVGLQINPFREAAADRMALLAGSREDTGPLEIESAGGEGWLPSMDAIAIMLLDNLTEEDVALSQAETFEQAVPRRITRKATFLSALQDARDVWNGIKRKLQTGGAEVHYTVPLGVASEDIKGYLRGSFSTRLNDNLNGIVFRSVRTLDSGRMILRHQVFANNLETYIFARTGLVVSFDMDGERIDDIHIRYLHLANLRAGTNLWNAMKANTESHISSTDMTHFTDSGWGTVKEIIAGRSHEEPVWHTSEFRLHPDFVREVVVILRNLGNVQVDEWDEYRNPNLVSSSKAGLRVATHGELTGGTMPAAAIVGRQSHHIPQYLLVEYFRNNNRNNALFESDEDRIPGFYPHRRRSTREQNLVKFSTTGAAGSTINFRNYDPNDSESSRGDGLPAISLAARTHQRGRLHMNAASTWGVDDELNPPSSQGIRINTQFMASLGLQSGIQSDKRGIANLVAGMEDNSPELTQVRQKVYTAIKRTYSTMYNVMMTALPIALRSHEVQYYTEAAMVKHDVNDPANLPEDPHNYKPNESGVDDAEGAIRQKNTDVMTEWT